MAKSIVKSIRVSESLDYQIGKIANDYGISDSHLINAVLTTFCLEYAKQLVKDFSPDEVKKDIE